MWLRNDSLNIVSIYNNHKIQWIHFLFLPPYFYMYPTAPVIAQHNQQSTSVEANRVTVNTTGNTFAGKPEHERDACTTGGTLLITTLRCL